jgi:hypothetical protein
MTESRLIYDLIDLPVGNLAVIGVEVSRWGRELTIKCLYRYPPEEKTFKLIFNDCSSIQWFVARPGDDGAEVAQLLTHDLGQGNHQRTARIATVLFELIIAYGELHIEQD